MKPLPKLRKNIVFNNSRNMFGYLLESPHWGDSNKYPKHALRENMNITMHFLHIILLIKDSLQQQLHFHGTIFGSIQMLSL